jgi:hypothetical protein
VDAEDAGKHRGWDLGGELDQRGLPHGAGLDADAA